MWVKVSACVCVYLCMFGCRRMSFFFLFVCVCVLIRMFVRVCVRVCMCVREKE